MVKHSKNKLIDRVVNLLFTVLLGLEVSMITISFFVDVMQRIYEIESAHILSRFVYLHPIPFIILVIVFSVISTLGIAYEDKVQGNWKKNIFKIVSCLSVTVTFLLLIFGTVNKLKLHIDEKIKYEIACVGEIEYIVLSEYDDKVVLAQYDSEQNVIDTRKYRVVDKKEIEYNKYFRMNQKPNITKDSSLK